MMGFQIVVLWSDELVWLLVVASVVLGVVISRNPPLRSAWQRVGANRIGMASATVLLAFVLIGLLLMPLIGIANLVLCIIAGIKANNGESYRYPFALRLIK